jgi:hypothetical protein
MLTIVLRTCAWGLTGFFAYTVYEAVTQTPKAASRMHQIPCSKCQYFTQDYFLKCTVHPHRALSEDAIDCRDFEKQDG